MSPLIARALTFSSPEEEMGYLDIIHFADLPNDVLGIRPNVDDSLVLMSLAHMLNQSFLRAGTFSDKSFCFHTDHREFSKSVLRNNKVSYLFQIDLTRSLMTISRTTLLMKLPSIVIDSDVMELIVAFLYSPILDPSGKDLSYIWGYGIPPSGLLTSVLLNFALTEFDMEFPKVFPGGLYYNKQVYK